MPRRTKWDCPVCRKGRLRCRKTSEVSPLRRVRRYRCLDCGARVLTIESEAIYSR